MKPQDQSVPDERDKYLPGTVFHELHDDGSCTEWKVAFVFGYVSLPNAFDVVVVDKHAIMSSRSIRNDVLALAPVKYHQPHECAWATGQLAADANATNVGFKPSPPPPPPPADKD